MTQKFGTRREQAKGETRRIIRQAAYSLFEEKGYEKSTMRELASRAGVGLGTIFQHFSSKSMLLISIFDEEMRQVVENAIGSVPPSGLKDQLHHLVSHVFEFYARRVRLSRVLIKEIIFMEGEGTENLRKLEMEYLEKLTGIFKKAVDRGELRQSINVTDAVTAFWSYYTHSILEGLNSPTFDIGRQLGQMDRLIDQLLKGIAVSSK